MLTDNSFFWYVFGFVTHIFQLTISEQRIEKMSNTIEPLDVNTTKEKQPEEIRVEVVQEEDTEDVLNMLKEYFFKVNDLYKNTMWKIRYL